MKTHPRSQITLSQAISGYLLAAEARHLSQNTLNDYTVTFRKFQTLLDDDPIICGISSKQVEAFLGAQTVSKKTVLNYHTGLSALWTWAVEERVVNRHILHEVERVKPEKRSIVPYSENQERPAENDVGDWQTCRRTGWDHTPIPLEAMSSSLPRRYFHRVRSDPSQ